MVELVVRRDRELRRPGQRVPEADRLRADAERRQGAIDLLLPRVLRLVRADVERERAAPRLEVEVRADRRERRLRHDRRQALQLRALRVVHVGAERRALRERLVVPPAQRVVAPPVAVGLVPARELAAQEAVGPLVLQLAVVAHEPGIEVRLPRAAAPVEPHGRVGVLVDGEVPAEVLDRPAIARTVADELRDAEARREQPAPPPLAHVLEDEGQPRHRDVADVEHRRARDHDAAAHHLHAARLEVVVRHREVAARDLAGVAVEAHRVVRAPRAVDGRALGAHVPPLAALDGGRDVRHDAAPRREVVADLPLGDHVLAVRRVAQDDDLPGVAAHDEEVRGVVEDDARADGDRLPLLHRGRRAGELDRLRVGVEGGGRALVARDRVAGAREQRRQHRVGRRPLHELRLRRDAVGARGGVGGERVAARAQGERVAARAARAVERSLPGERAPLADPRRRRRRGARPRRARAVGDGDRRLARRAGGRLRGGGERDAGEQRGERRECARRHGATPDSSGSRSPRRRGCQSSSVSVVP